MEKKRIKQWGKIKLFETSCCGIPAYPSAHKSLSLIKALMETDEPVKQLNIKEKPMQIKKEVEETVAPVEAPVEVKEEAKPEEEVKPEAETPEETVAAESEVSEKKANVDLTKALTDALVKAIGIASTERGLVATEKVDLQEEVSKKSMGELAVGMGMFKVDSSERVF